MPGDDRVPVESTEPPPPCHLFSVSGDNTVLSTPERFLRNPREGAGEPKIFQKLLPRVHIGLTLRQTHQ